jgi:hypothetical protein
MSEILHAKLATVRRKHAGVAIATGVTAAIGVAVLILVATMLLDWWLNLPEGWRVAFLAVNVAAVVFILLSRAAAPILYGPDDDEIALMVEDAEPAFRTRLISSVQLSRPNAVPAGASGSLVRAMIAQAESLAGPMDFARVIKTEALTRLIVMVLMILIVGVGLFAWAGEPAQALLKRAFLSNVPVPRATRVLPITESFLAARGDGVELIAYADGTFPPEDRRRLFIRTEGGRKQDFRMERVTPDAARIDQLKQILATSHRDPKALEALIRKLDNDKDQSPIFAATVNNVQESFSYWMRLNDGESDEFKVAVLPRPTVTKVEVKQVYPAYTGKTVEPRGLGDLSILQGSKLQLAIAVNKDLARPKSPGDVTNFVHLIGSDKDVALALDDKSPRLLTGEFDVPAGTTGFSINLTDTDGLRSKDPAVYRIDLIPDKPPTVRILIPTRKEVLLVKDAKHRIVFEAVDDFAIGGVKLKYKVDEGAEKEIKLDLKGKTPRSFPGEYNWRLTEVQAAATTKPMLEGSVIEYWIEVEDTNTFARQPGRGISEHYMIRVVSEAEKRAEMAARIADIGSGLRSATEDQENLATRVQSTILLEKEQPPTPEQK